MGILRSEEISQGLLIRQVAVGSDAYLAGLGANDLVLEIDGQQIRNLDVEEYLRKVKRGTTINLKVISRLAVREVLLTYKGSLAPEKFRLSRQSKLKQQQRRLLEDWISTKQ